MPLSVSLSSGKPIPVLAELGSEVSVLRQDLGRTLDLNPSSIEIIVGDRILEDHDTILDDIVNVVLSPHPWLDDGSGHIKDLGGCAFEVVGKSSGPMNALCDVGLSGAEAYFEVEVVSGNGAWVGVGTKEGFAQGWRCQGLFFGGPGNLSNGSGALKCGFGESVKDGSIIGVSLDLSDPCSVGLKVIQNGKMLGLAFEKCPRAKDAVVFPVVRSQNAGDSFRIAFRQKERLQEQHEPPHPAIGRWRLIKFVLSGHLEKALVHGKDIPIVRKDIGAMLTVIESQGASADRFGLSFKVGETMHTNATVTRHADGELLALGPVIYGRSTLMPHSDEQEDLECQIRSALGCCPCRWCQCLPVLVPWHARRLSWHATQTSADPIAKELRICGTNVEMRFIADNSTCRPVTDDVLTKAIVDQHTC